MVLATTRQNSFVNNLSSKKCTKKQNNCDFFRIFTRIFIKFMAIPHNWLLRKNRNPDHEWWSGVSVISTATLTVPKFRAKQSGRLGNRRPDMIQYFTIFCRYLARCSEATLLPSSDHGHRAWRPLSVQRSDSGMDPVRFLLHFRFHCLSIRIVYHISPSFKLCGIALWLNAGFILQVWDLDQNHSTLLMWTRHSQRNPTEKKST